MGLRVVPTDGYASSCLLLALLSKVRHTFFLCLLLLIITFRRYRPRTPIKTEIPSYMDGFLTVKSEQVETDDVKKVVKKEEHSIPPSDETRDVFIKDEPIEIALSPEESEEEVPPVSADSHPSPPIKIEWPSKVHSSLTQDLDTVAKEKYLRNLLWARRALH